MTTNHAKPPNGLVRALVLLGLLVGASAAAALPSLPVLSDAPYGAWRIDEIDIAYGVVTPPDHGGPGFFSPIAVDSKGEPHLLSEWWDPSLSSVGEFVITYQRRVGAVWIAEDLMMSTSADIAIGADDQPRVVIHEGRLNALLPLWYGTRTDSGWVYEQIVSAANALKPRLVLDANGVPHVAWLDGDRGIVYATKDQTGAWVLEIVESYSEFADLAVDASGRPYLAYTEQSFATSRLIIAERTAPGVWSKDFATPCGRTVSYAIGVEASGKLHVACVTVDVGFQYTTRTNGVWSPGTLLGPDHHGSDVDLALHTDGTPHLAYTGAGSAKVLWHARLGTSGWMIERADILGRDVGANPGIALDSFGTPRIAYFVWEGASSVALGGVHADDLTLRYAEPAIGGALGVIVGVHPVLRGTLA